MVFNRPGKPVAIPVAKSRMNMAFIIRIFITPLFSGFPENCHTQRFVCNSLEFGGITIGVAYLFPEADELYGIFLPKPLLIERK